METKETLEKEIVEITVTIEKLKKFKLENDLNEADKRNWNRNLEEAKSKLEIAKRELENIK